MKFKTNNNKYLNEFISSFLIILFTTFTSVFTVSILSSHNAFIESMILINETIFLRVLLISSVIIIIFYFYKKKNINITFYSATINFANKKNSFKQYFLIVLLQIIGAFFASIFLFYFFTFLLNDYFSLTVNHDSIKENLLGSVAPRLNYIFPASQNYLSFESFSHYYDFIYFSIQIFLNLILILIFIYIGKQFSNRDKMKKNFFKNFLLIYISIFITSVFNCGSFSISRTICPYLVSYFFADSINIFPFILSFFSVQLLFGLIIFLYIRNKKIT